MKLCDLHQHSSFGTRLSIGRATFTCECGGQVDTDRAKRDPVQLKDPVGLLWVGVPCDGKCGHTYTVEMRNNE